MKLKKKLRDNQIILSIIVLIVSSYLFILGLFGVILTDHSPESLLYMADAVGNWIYWFLVLGGFLIIVFTYYIIDIYRKIKEINELMDTESKSKFIKNIARIETLALHLGSDYEEKVIEKEEEYNIDR